MEGFENMCWPVEDNKPTNDPNCVTSGCEETSNNNGKPGAGNKPGRK